MTLTINALNKPGDGASNSPEMHMYCHTVSSRYKHIVGTGGGMLIAKRIHISGMHIARVLL